MAESREDQIRRLLEIAARAGQREELEHWLRSHPDARVLPWILSGSSSGAVRVCYPQDKPPERRGRPRKRAG